MKKVSKIFNKFLACFVACIVVLTTVFSMTNVSNAQSKEAKPEGEPIGHITVSMEKFTIGLGYIIEPQIIPIYKGDTGAKIVDRLLGGPDNYTYTGSIDNQSGIVGQSFYLASVKDDDYRDIKVPKYITDVADESYGRTEEGWLGEFDYTFMSGWMYAVNNWFPNYGSGQYFLKDGDVMRWQFTYWGYGGDLGSSFMSQDTSQPALIPLRNKDELTTEVAKINSADNKEALLKDSNVKKAYDNALTVLQNMESTQESINKATETLRSAKNSYTKNVSVSFKTIVFNNNNTYDPDSEKIITKDIEKGDTLNYQPEELKSKGYVFLGWYKDINDIKTKYKNNQVVNENTVYTAKWVRQSTENATAEKTSDNRGKIKFDTKIYNFIDKAKTIPCDKIVEKGTLIIPTNLLKVGDSLQLDTPRVAKSIGRYTFEKNDDYLEYLGTLVNIPQSQFDRSMMASAYVTYKDKSGNEYTVYSPYTGKNSTVNTLLGK